MKTKYALITPLLLLLHSVFSQNCFPSDACSKAPSFNLHGLVVSTAGYSMGGEKILCPNGSAWSVQNDLWIAFTPRVVNLTITADILGDCSSGSGIQALIHEDCANDPIDCDVDCGGSPEVGAGINFVVGRKYYFRLDGCSGAICDVQLTVFPADALEPESIVLTPKWPPTGLIVGSTTFQCSGKDTLSYSTVLNPCAVQYEWKIKSGDAQILAFAGDNLVDVGAGGVGTNVLITGANRNRTRLIVKNKTQDVVLSVTGLQGTATTNETTITIKSPNAADRVRNELICPDRKEFMDPNIIGGPYLPNDTCGRETRYQIMNIDTLGCRYNLQLNLTRFCDSVAGSVDLGLVNVCPNSFLVIDDRFYSDTTQSYQVIGIAPEFPNKMPPFCNPNYHFRLKEIIPNKKLGKNGLLYCAADSVRLVSHNQYESNVTATYQWEKYSLNGPWEKIPQATSAELVVREPGFYRLYQEISVKNVLSYGTFTGESCLLDFYSEPVAIAFETSIVNMGVASSGRRCLGDTISLRPNGNNTNLDYFWYNVSTKNEQQLTEYLLPLTSSEQQICLFAKNHCLGASDTICERFSGFPQLSVPPSLISNSSSCIGEDLLVQIGNYDPKLEYFWSFSQDSINTAVSAEKTFFTFYFAGKYDIRLDANNKCNTISTPLSIIVEKPISKPSIYGPIIVTEKTTQTYCVYSPTPNVIWKSSKGLKYKQYYKNGQSCIAVTFTKLTNSGWLVASHSNSCGTEKDSIYVFVKPKTASAETVPISATSDQIETRQGDSFSNAVLELFPSPAKDLLQIKCNQPYNRVQCTDLLGRSVELKPSELSTYSISFLRPGLYQISIYKERHRIATQKFVKID